MASRLTICSSRALLKLLKVEEDEKVEIIPQDEGLLIKKVDARSAYREVSKKHRKSLGKLGE